MTTQTLEHQRRRLYAATSVLLRYPDEVVLEQIPKVREAVRPLDHDDRSRLLGVCDWLVGLPPLQAQEHYVGVFDRTRKACLYLSYYLNGDTRLRGMALVGFKELYRAGGWEVTDDELPDFLPVVLEFAAVGDVRLARDLLLAHRVGLELLSKVLLDAGSGYAPAVTAVLDSLPVDHEASTSALVLAAQGPPAELVGLEPFPFADATRSGAQR
jgi:nitrate reductase molybdenum cofactor assembly chaperone NarJ/NarW